MDIIRRNTDYAIRAMIHLGRSYKVKAVTAKEISKEQDISYDLTCKLLQKLKKSKLLTSSMGPSGGYSLAKGAGSISLLMIVETIQGRVCMNRCLIDTRFCPRKKGCPVSKTLGKIQKELENSLSKTTLKELV